ncbi:uncharacterized protein BT62DRAFT_120531 [Guyanagaster necrorhizus]|uniref:Uncharacterized protein n=1 Tax=Guyanagaster necrorhizus TaxID=856835 RepID=A0A9P7VTB5_9AGAR|nr:uncharacterized protein BT62DRAFT_120531 [Guyanagaster necrorhizus MCA 3950]KAG7446462.1 hypothetical protein BT62DRAFT_120531 [Guyanagaster necrorhizus MCA 3950]
MVLTSATDSERLSVKRISRLLRSLRIRCKALRLCGTIRTTQFATYPCRRGANCSDTPLFLLPPPNSAASRLVFDRNSSAAVELSRKIYAVRDAFRDLVLNTRPPDRKSFGTASSITLAALCATVIGENMELEDDESGRDAEGEQEEDSVELLYEAVPAPYRRWTLFSHAVNMIISVCPPHATLHRILLDTTLEQGLFHESETLLGALLVLGLSSTEICHPLHSDFLTELHGRWCASTGYTEQSFLKIMADSLLNIRTPNIWLSKPVDRFIHNSSVEFFVRAACILMEFLVRESLDEQSSVDLSRKLVRWIYRRFLTLEESCHDVMLDLIVVCDGLTTDRCQSGWMQELRCAVACVGTRLLLKCKGHHHCPLLAYLRKVAPLPSTYGVLVEHSFVSSANFQDAQAQLQEYSTALHAHNLHQLDASILSCILCHVDRLLDSLYIERAEAKAYQEELIELVDDAEKRCFGMADKDEGQFVWESIVGCWIRSPCDLPPPRKRLKRVHSPTSEPDSTIIYDDWDSADQTPPFASLLRKAASSRTILHRTSPKKNPFSQPLSSPARQCPSSDDALNLFVYPTSPI